MMDIVLDNKMLSSVVADNSSLGLGGVIGVKRQQELLAGSATPYDSGTPIPENNYIGSPEYGAEFSPIAEHASETGGFSEYQPQGGFGGFSPYGRSPGWIFSSLARWVRYKPKLTKLLSWHDWWLLSCVACLWRSKPWLWSFLARILAHESKLHPNFASLLTNLSFVRSFAHIAELLANFTELLTHEPWLQFADFAKLLTHIASIQSDFAWVWLAHLPKLQPDLASIQSDESSVWWWWSQTLTHFAIILSCVAKLLTHESDVAYLSIVLAD